MYKTCVYAICKNESSSILSWLNGVKEADEVFVLDTGSTDGTYEILQQSGVKCAQKIFESFRFDEARNESLRMAPQNCHIYLPLDIDMTLPKGWSFGLRTAWSERLLKLEIPQYYKNTNRSGIWFAHKRDVRWKYPVYEQIEGKGEVKQTANLIIVHDWWDCKDSHDIYPALAEQGVIEYPNDYYCRHARHLILEEQKRKLNNSEVKIQNG